MDWNDPTDRSHIDSKCPTHGEKPFPIPGPMVYMEEGGEFVYSCPCGIIIRGKWEGEVERMRKDHLLMQSSVHLHLGTLYIWSHEERTYVFDRSKKKVSA
jgi:hypothetical protein